MIVKRGQYWATILLWVLSGCTGSTFVSESSQPDDFPLQSAALSGKPELAGMVPVAQVLSAARRDGVVLTAPSELVRDYKTAVGLSPMDTWWEVIRKTEYVFNLVYDAETKELRPPTATHMLDGPDDAGRATATDRLGLGRREMLRLRFKFVRGSASATIAGTDGTGFNIGGNGVEFAASIPAGVKRTWSVGSTRRYFEGRTNTETGNNVDTQLREIPSGVTFDGLGGTLPGGSFRLQANLKISAFDDQLNTSDVVIPLDADGPRSEWLHVFTFRAASAGMRASLKGIGLTLSGSGEAVAVMVRVD